MFVASLVIKRLCVSLNFLSLTGRIEISFYYAVEDCYYAASRNMYLHNKSGTRGHAGLYYFLRAYTRSKFFRRLRLPHLGAGTNLSSSGMKRSNDDSA